VEQDVERLKIGGTTG